MFALQMVTASLLFSYGAFSGLVRFLKAGALSGRRPSVRVLSALTGVLGPVGHTNFVKFFTRKRGSMCQGKGPSGHSGGHRASFE